MAYYLLFHHTIKDAETFQKYAPPAIATVSQYGGKILAATGLGMGDAKVVERTPQHAVTVLLEFESEAAADRWYHSSEYQALVNMRLGATDGWTQGLPAFQPPT
jgi:uncharacterized protein (DUF1330 family)